jgi:transposase
MLGAMRPQATADQLEQRRCRAIHLGRRDKAVTTIAQTVGAGQRSVWRWVQTYQEEGMPGLRARPIPGRPSYLSAEQKAHLAQVLLHGARAAGYQTELWTLKRIAKAIWQEFHVRYQPNALWYLLRGMGWSCQKPQRRACQRDEAAIAHWTHYRWPHIKNGCAPGGALGFPGRKWLFAHPQP